MDIKYVGWADVRNLKSTDVRPLFDSEGEVVEEDPWEYTWELKFGGVLPVADDHVERVLEVGDFRQANDDEVEEAIRLLDAHQNWASAEGMRQRRAQLMSESEGLVVSEAQLQAEHEADGSAGDDDTVDNDEPLTDEDQRPQLDD